MTSQNWLTDLQTQFPKPQPSFSSLAITNTIHVSFRPGMTDRGKLYVYFRKLKGFRLIGFYDTYCFVRFENKHYASAALSNPPFGSITLEPAKISYKVPYPQPQDNQVVSCMVLHITHLPPNSYKDEVESMFGVFEGLTSIQLHGKYGYAHFKTEMQAMQARTVLRAETNLVISFAKNSSRPIPTFENEKMKFEKGLPGSPNFDSFSRSSSSVLQESIDVPSFSQEYSNKLSSIQPSRSKVVANLNIGGAWPESPTSHPSPSLLSGISTPSSTYSEYPWSRRSSVDISQSGYHKFPSHDANFLDAGKYELASLYPNHRDIDQRNISTNDIQLHFLQLQLLEHAYQQQQLQNRRQIYFTESNSRYTNQNSVSKDQWDNSIEYSQRLENLTEAFAGAHLQDQTPPASNIWAPFQSKLPSFTYRV
ncbi:hypothetical protein HK096_003002 [Nowakowskiella sp. JEL0078]|nr:hypothetical protein HK096_003002 [Nowakowskiella sp. JEL0078]